jgi:hypothetical protein
MTRSFALLLAMTLCAASGGAAAGASKDAISGPRFDLACTGTAEVVDAAGQRFTFASEHRLRVDTRAGAYFVESGQFLGRPGEARVLRSGGGRNLVLSKAAATTQDDFDAAVDRRSGAYVIDNRWRGAGFSVTSDRGSCRQEPFTPFAVTGVAR